MHVQSAVDIMCTNKTLPCIDEKQHKENGSVDGGFKSLHTSSPSTWAHAYSD